MAIHGLGIDDEEMIKIEEIKTENRGNDLSYLIQAREYYSFYKNKFQNGSQEIIYINSDDRSIIPSPYLSVYLNIYHLAIECLLKCLLCLKNSFDADRHKKHDLDFLIEENIKYYPQLNELDKEARLLLEVIGENIISIRYNEACIMIRPNRKKDSIGYQELSEKFDYIYHFLHNLAETVMNSIDQKN